MASVTAISHSCCSDGLGDAYFGRVGHLPRADLHARLFLPMPVGGRGCF